ncbi:MAG TPA: S8 family peptidase, partial [Vicinamibacterales bacterium]
MDVLYEGPQAEVDRLAAAYRVRVMKRLPSGAVFSGSSYDISALSMDQHVGALSQDDRVLGMTAVTSQSTGSSQLWKAAGNSGNFSGITGKGIGVAIIDSGIARHGDLINRLTLSLDFRGEATGEEVAWSDEYGHGTHVASIIAGSGKGSQTAEGSAYVGMAPGAHLLSLRVLGADGSGYVSDVLEAIHWTIENREKYKIRVINLSLGHPASGLPLDDPMAKAVEQAVEAGLVVVASAGNLGKLEDGTPVVGAIISPGYTPGALTVGALNTRGTVARSDDVLATFSSRGPVGSPDEPSSWQMKPDIVAPGNAVVAAVSEQSALWVDHPQRRIYGENGGTYLKLSGTSMSAAVVSGAVAQLLQAQPKLTPREAKLALQVSAQFLEGYGLAEQGAGSLNVALAATLVQSKDTPIQPWNVIAGE